MPPQTEKPKFDATTAYKVAFNPGTAYGTPPTPSGPPALTGEDFFNGRIRQDAAGNLVDSRTGQIITTAKNLMGQAMSDQAAATKQALPGEIATMATGPITEALPIGAIGRNVVKGGIGAASGAMGGSLAGRALAGEQGRVPGAVVGGAAGAAIPFIPREAIESVVPEFLKGTFERYFPTTPAPTPPTAGESLMARGTPTGIPEDASPNIGRPSFTMGMDKNGVRWATAPDGVKVSVSGPMSKSEVEGLLDSQRQAQAAIKSRYAIGITPTSSTGGPVQIGIGKTPQLQPELGSPENPGFHAKLPTRMPKTPTPARIGAPPVQWRTETPSVASPPVKWGTAAPEPAKVNPPPVRWSQGGGPKSISSVVSGGGGNAGEIGASPVEREIQTIMQKPIVTPEEQGRVEQILGPNSRMRQGEGVSDWQARVTGMFKAARGRTQ